MRSGWLMLGHTVSSVRSQVVHETPGKNGTTNIQNPKPSLAVIKAERSLCLIRSPLTWGFRDILEAHNEVRE